MPNPILLDAMMPDTDGFEVGHILRNDPELTTIRVVMGFDGDGHSTGRTSRAGHGGTRVTGDLLNKPFSPVKLYYPARSKKIKKIDLQSYWTVCQNLFINSSLIFH